MKYQILIDTEKNKQLTSKEAGDIIGALNSLDYKGGMIQLFKPDENYFLEYHGEVKIKSFDGKTLGAVQIPKDQPLRQRFNISPQVMMGATNFLTKFSDMVKKELDKLDKGKVEEFMGLMTRVGEQIVKPGELKKAKKLAVKEAKKHAKKTKEEKIKK